MNREKPIADYKGEYINCAMRETYPTGKTFCSALVNWYNRGDGNHCSGCTFFKTKERVEKEKMDFHKRHNAGYNKA